MARWTWTDEQLKAQLHKAARAGRLAEKVESRAATVRYVRSSRKLVVTLRSGVVVTIPIALLPYFEGATERQITDVDVSPLGRGLRWKALDLDLSVPALLARTLEPPAAMAELGRIGGSRTSRAKAQAARENGKKGGRPRKRESATA
jgi:hypothetical protein